MAFLDKKAVGERLKEKRKETNLSPRQFAIQAGIDQSQYSKIEKGDLPITENIMNKLVKHYGLDKNSILHGTNVPRETVNGSTSPTGAQNSPQTEKTGLDPIKEKLADYGALLSVLVFELASLRSSISGEHQEVLTKKIYKAAEDLKKVSG